MRGFSSKETTAQLICHRDDFIGDMPARPIIRTFRVVGIAPSQGPEIISQSYGWRYRTAVFDLRWPAEKSERLLSFYEQFYANSTRHFWNCHVFAAYMLGRGLCISDSSTSPVPIPGRSIAVGALQNAKPYCVVAPGNKVMHSVLGMSGSKRCLSVLGRYGDLVVSPNQDITHCYGGDYHEYTYDAVGQVQFNHGIQLGTVLPTLARDLGGTSKP
jgi:hypothetical protein